MFRSAYFIVHLIITIVGRILSYPTGAPRGACQSMTPGYTGHGYTEYSGPAPYSVHVIRNSNYLGDLNTYTLGSIITGEP